ERRDQASVALIVHDQETPLLPVHLSDVLPGHSAKRVQNPAVTERDDPDLATLHEARGGTLPAISHGESVRLPLPATLPDILTRAATEHPTHGVTYYRRDGSQFFQPYPELLQDAQRILRGLRTIGLQPQDSVIFQCTRNEDFVPAYWACMLGGYVPAPLGVPSESGEHGAAVAKLRNCWEMLGRPTILSDADLAND